MTESPHLIQHSPTMPRRQVLRVLSAALASGGLLHATGAAAQPRKPPLAVWKSPTCGCCGDWIEHMRKGGFEVTAHDTGNTAVRSRLGIPMKLGSCHTAEVGGYALEGHVPASDVWRLLRERPDPKQVVGLVVPGMPVGSPGMDDAVYGPHEAYDVLLLMRNGSTRVWQHHPVRAAARRS
jgi:hypothetical protein